MGGGGDGLARLRTGLWWEPRAGLAGLDADLRLGKKLARPRRRAVDDDCAAVGADSAYAKPVRRSSHAVTVYRVV